VNLGQPVLLKLRMIGGSGGDNWSYKSCNAAVKLSPAINQHPTFLKAGMAHSDCGWTCGSAGKTV